MKWEKVLAKGDIPAGVAAHSAVVLGKNMYIFGGMTASGACNSMYRFNTGMKSLTCWFVLMSYSYSFIFCMSFQKSKLKLMFQYQTLTDKSRWILMKFEGDMPPNRLDHSMCLLPWRLEGEEKANSTAASDTINLAFIFGGMDTQGVVHNDCIVTVLTWYDQKL